MAARSCRAAVRRAARSCPLKACLASTPKIEIIRKRADFLAVAASGKKWVAPGFILQIGAAHDPAPAIRYGLTASRKVGNAVTRNRAKRRLRALAAELLPYATSEHDYVLIARDMTPVLPFDAMRQDMVKGMKRMKVWRD
ncbi:MAG: ribonuclease P protein component [Alphaproteobacteria bacterium]|nr:ribonuclease P protein component [Alphaproteobacteria bacterium]